MKSGSVHNCEKIFEIRQLVLNFSFLKTRISYRQFAAASRAGGQKINRKATAVELRYAPTGTIVWCQDKRTPELNFELALLNLRKAREYH